jgi:hypothetical protein
MTDPSPANADRIRQVLDAATADAPVAPSWPPMHRAEVNARHRTTRWLTVAAAIAFVAGGVAVLARQGDGHRAVAPATDSASPSDLNTVPETPIDCGSVSVAGYDGVGTIYTELPETEPFDVLVETDRVRVCTGGRLAVRVTITNRSTTTVKVDYPYLKLTGFARWALDAGLTAFSLGPRERRVFNGAVNIPAAPPGTYQLSFRNFASSATLTIEGPKAPVCPQDCLPTTPTTSPSDQTGTPPTCVNPPATASEPHHEGALEWVGVTITNNGEAPCRLRQAPSHITQSNGIAGPVFLATFQQPPAPLGDAVARPGESFWMAVYLDGCSTPTTPTTWTLQWADTEVSLVAPALCSSTEWQVTRLGFAAPHTPLPQWAGLATCTLGDLTAGTPLQGSGMGNAFTEIPLTNTSASPCATPAAPRGLDLIDPTGRHPATTTKGNDSDYFGEREPAPTIMFPGDRIILPLSWGGAECTDQSYRTTGFVLTLDIGELPVQGLICPPVALDPPAIPIDRPPG